MSEQPEANPEREGGGPGDPPPPEETPQGVMLEHELVEVMLLLDHLSSVKVKTLPTELENEPIFKAKDGEPQRDWIQQICEIVWPPALNAPEKLGENAAKLLRAKDALNGMAAPATGESIAFSVMMMGEAKKARRRAGSRWPLSRGADDPPEPDPEDLQIRAGSLQPALPKRTRADLAIAAYPNLARSAWKYNIWMRALVPLLIVFLICTMILSWDVGTGTALLNRYNTLEARIVDLHKAAVTNRPGAGTGDAAAHQSPGASPNCPATAPTPCPNAGPGSAAERAEQSALDRATQQQEIVARSLRKWLNQDGGLRNLLIRLMGGYGQVQILDQPAAERADIVENVERNNDYIEWAAVAIGVLAGTILPIFYGLTGACAAVVRIISAKVRDSVLLPRDIWLAYVRLALGGVIGACVGLFVTPNGMPNEPGGLLGTVHLSASALCFVAGFGVEGVFQALEELVRRVFNLDSLKTPTPGAGSGAAAPGGTP